MEECPVGRVAHLLGNKWALLIIRDLASGFKRFGELQRSMGHISPRTLSARLSTLEEAGIVERRAYAEIPPRVEYSLTEKGRALLPLLHAMRDYGEKWLRPILNCQTEPDKFER
ncbi:MAG: helix-turn-helix transcriptional regulator [Anaerolineales bacterium]|nr:helix-turn-helix transcriptional regulator [Anaerolineales bacterium]